MERVRTLSGKRNCMQREKSGKGGCELRCEERKEWEGKILNGSEPEHGKE